MSLKPTAAQYDPPVGRALETYLERRHEDTVIKAWSYLETVCRDIWAEGKTVTRREVVARVPAEILSPVAHLLDVLKEVQAHLQNTGPVEETIYSIGK